MENFAVVQSLIRAGLDQDTVTFRKQIKRLRTRLVKAGDEKAVETLDRLVEQSQNSSKLDPTDVSLSRMHISGEILQPGTHSPLDKETGANLAEIIFPTDFLKSDIPIYDAAIQRVIDGFLKEWDNPEALASLGVEPTRTILIFGPPGSGKTLTANYVAYRLGLPLISARIDGLISSFLGTTARNIANLFTFANRFQCVLLLDEFDAIAKLRDDPQEVGEIKRVVNTLLQNLDQRKSYGLTVAITNHDRLLDPAVWRRFQTQIHLGDPSDGARLKLVERYMHPMKVSNGLMQIIGHCLEGRSGAEIERLCESTKRELAIHGPAIDDQAVISAFSEIISRMPEDNGDKNNYLSLLKTDLDLFIGRLANDPEIKVNQAELADIFGRTQPSISRLRSGAKTVSEASNGE